MLAQFALLVAAAAFVLAAAAMWRHSAAGPVLMYRAYPARPYVARHARRPRLYMWQQL